MSCILLFADTRKVGVIMPSDRCLSSLWRSCIVAKGLNGSRWNLARR